MTTYPGFMPGFFLGGICLSDPNRRCPYITDAGRPSLEPVKDLLQDGRKRRGVLRVKCIGLIAVDIKDSNQRTLPIGDRDDQFGSGGAGAGNMVFKSLNISYDLYLLAARRSAAYTA